MKNIGQIFVGIFLLFFLLASCQSNKEIIKTSQPMSSVSVGDVQVDVTYLDRDFLIQEYGKKKNPFVDTSGDLDGIMGSRELIVFELEVTTEGTELVLEEGAILLVNGENTAKHKPLELLCDLWSFYLGDEYDRTDFYPVARKKMVRGTFQITPETPLKTYLVFEAKFTPKGEATIDIPAVTSTGDQGVIEIPFTFLVTEDGSNSDLELDEEGNVKQTGIFSE